MIDRSKNRDQVFVLLSQHLLGDDLGSSTDSAGGPFSPRHNKYRLHEDAAIWQRIQTDRANDPSGLYPEGARNFVFQGTQYRDTHVLVFLLLFATDFGPWHNEAYLISEQGEQQKWLKQLGSFWVPVITRRLTGDHVLQFVVLVKLLAEDRLVKLFCTNHMIS